MAAGKDFHRSSAITEMIKSSYQTYSVSRPERKMRYTSAMLWLLVVSAVIGVVESAVSSLSTSVASAKDATVNKKNYHQSLSTGAYQRAVFVREILSHRLDYVHSGRRTRDFSQWIKARRGEAAIFSMHGVEPESATENDFLEEVDSEHSAVELSHNPRRDPFAANRINLDLVVTIDSPPGCYEGKKALHLMDNKPPNLLQLCVRATVLGFHFAPVLSTVGLAVVSKKFRQQVWYGWLASCIGSSGAAWIKWGQWSSTRNDMFPDALCDCLATLHSDAPAHSWEISEKTMESSLGLAEGTLVPYVFDSFDQEPIASGSIAQVHKAVLHGELVAVKIRHPNVARNIDMDFRLMTFAARIFDWIPGLSWLHIRESVEQFSHTMAAQSDLHVEAHHLEVLNHNFRRWPHVGFPHPFYASSGVIIETFEPGSIVTGVIDTYEQYADELNSKITLGGSKDAVVIEPDSDDHSITEPDDSPLQHVAGRDLIPVVLAKFLVTTGLGIYLKMLLVDNLMHADLHPGNIMVNLNRSRKGIGSKSSESVAMVPHNPSSREHQMQRMLGICLVDAGMVAQLTDEESATFIGLLSSLGEGDGVSAAEFALQFSLENNMDPVERKAFTQDMIALFEERCRGYGNNVDVGHVLRGILGLIRVHKVRIDANFATLVVNALCIESLARTVCPSYNVLDAAKPLLQSYRRLCYSADGTPRPAARKSKLVKLWLSLMYVQKNALDALFFKREGRKIRQRTEAILTAVQTN